MRAAPFGKSGHFYRGNLHTHSTRSDGERTPEDVCRIYRELGYDFLAITDHFREKFGYPITDSAACNEAEFITLPGAELHAGETTIGELWHILAVGLPGDFPPNQPGESASEIVERALQAGAFIAAAHPAWYGLEAADVLSLGNIHAIEVYNGGTAGLNDRSESWYLADQLAAKGHRYGAIATDDAHFDPDFQDAQLGWVWVKAAALTPAALIDALKAGDYYSSTGPMILDIDVEPGRFLRVRCSPAAHIIVSGRGSASARLHGQGLIDAELSLIDWKSAYCRVTVVDQHGERAWSNILWFDQ